MCLMCKSFLWINILINVVILNCFNGIQFIAVCLYPVIFFHAIVPCVIKLITALIIHGIVSLPCGLFSVLKGFTEYKHSWLLLGFLAPWILLKTCTVSSLAVIQEGVEVMCITINGTKLVDCFAQFMLLLLVESGLMHGVYVLSIVICSKKVHALLQVSLLLSASVHLGASAASDPQISTWQMIQQKHQGRWDIAYEAHSYDYVKSPLCVQYSLPTAILLFFPYASTSPGKQVPGNPDNPPCHSKSPREAAKRKLYSSSTSSSKNSDERPTMQNKCDEDDEKPPTKKGRKRQLHDGNPCDPCIVWLLLGGDPQYADEHSMEKNVNHPRDNADFFSKYLSWHGFDITLSSENCMCNKCYKDCLNNADKPNATPRWVTVHKKNTYTEAHCAVCHFEVLQYSPGHKTPCKNHIRWAPPNWLQLQGFTYKFWQKYFIYTRPNFTIRLNDSSQLCYRHFMETYNKVKDRICKICLSKNDDSWDMPFEKMVRFNSILEKRGQSKIQLEPTDWMCKSCISKLNSPEPTSQQSVSSPDPDKLYIKQAVEEALQKVKQMGYIFRRDLVKTFKSEVKNHAIVANKSDFQKMFENSLTKHVSMSEDIDKYSTENGIGLVGTLYYDTDQVSSTVAHSIYDTLCQAENDQRKIQSLEEEAVKISDIYKMIDRQVELFSSGGTNFDYCKLFDNTNCDDLLLKDYLYQPFVDFLCKICKCGKYGTASRANAHKEMLKCQMAMAILCNMKNMGSVFLQKLVGYVLFTGGLKNKATNMLCAFGITVSSTTLETEAKFWAENRNPTQELNPNKLWRLSFDNLNFKRRYAKTAKFGVETCGRMLNLLTSQVTHNDVQENDLPLSFVTNNETLLKEDNFFLTPGSHEYGKWCIFMNAISEVGKHRAQTINETITTFLDDLQTKLPSFTPPVADNIVYTRVEESQASSIDDVCSFLLKLKTELKIGQENHPNKCVVCGDQQTYVLLQNLIRKFPNDFNWVLPVPGHWHLLKLASEVLRDLLWDGGLKELAKECGHNKELVQWKDVHRMLLGLHESLTFNAVMKWNTKDETYESFLKTLASDDNADEICRFWASILQYLNAYIGYYWAIRSGDWVLHQACLPKLSELFFAYGRNKYEELVCQTRKDCHQLPHSVQEAFLKGEWTVSASGRPYHNMAMDEAHEALINKRTKELTSRPSEHRIVTLAGFMAVLHKVYYNLATFINRFSSEKKGKKPVQNDYSRKIYQKLQTTDLFLREQRLFANTLGSDTIDTEQKKDLFEIEKEGKARMVKYVRQYVLDPPTEVRQKRSRQKLKTFSKSKSSVKKQQSKVSRLTKMARSLSTRLQQSGQFYDRVLEFPLAMCDEYGCLRSRNKSIFKEAILSIPQLQSIFTPHIPFNIIGKQQTEVIVDALKYVHMPPSPSKLTYADHSLDLFERIVKKLGYERGISVVTVVFDKPPYLPRIRDALHEERKRGCATAFVCPESIDDLSAIPHGKQYMEALTHPKYKSLLLDYLSISFLSLAKNTPKDTLVIIDSPTFDKMPMGIWNGTTSQMEERENNKGEADNGLWYHARCSSAEQIIINAGDTDIYMYGIALCDRGGYERKEIAVERSLNTEYVHVSSATRLFQEVPEFKDLNEKRLSGLCMLAVYLLSGSDYLSGFFKITNKGIMSVYTKYIDFINQGNNDPLVEVETPGLYIISQTSYLRLMCCVYLDKHFNLYRHLYSTPVLIWDALQLDNNSLSPEMKTFLHWLQYDLTKETEIGSLRMFSDFTRRVCYFDCQGNRDLFKMILPSDSALKLHVCRGTYVLKIVMESSTAITGTYKDAGEGWTNDKEKMSIKWEEDIEGIKRSLKYKKVPLAVGCGCAKGCALSKTGTSRCKSCSKQCKPCIADRCKCKAQCNNPHNNGGTCLKCAKVSTDDAAAQNTVENDINDDINGDGSEMDTDSEDSEEEYRNDEMVGYDKNTIGFNEFFNDLGHEGMFELIPDSNLIGGVESEDDEDEM